MPAATPKDVPPQPLEQPLPVELTGRAANRLTQTVARLRDRLQAATAAPALDGLVDRLAAQLQQRQAAGDARAPLRWVSASGGDGWPESLSFS